MGREGEGVLFREVSSLFRSVLIEELIMYLHPKDITNLIPIFYSMFC